MKKIRKTRKKLGRKKYYSRRKQIGGGFVDNIQRMYKLLEILRNKDLYSNDNNIQQQKRNYMQKKLSPRELIIKYMANLEKKKKTASQNKKFLELKQKILTEMN